MTKRYELVSLNNELYMIDRETKPVHGNYFAFTDAKGNMTGFDKMDSDTDWTHSDSPLIISSTDKSLNLPLLPAVEDNIEVFAEEAFDKFLKENPIVPGNHKNPFKLGYLKGYNAASAKKYTEEDIRKAYWAGDGLFEGGTTFEEFLQSLTPKPIAIELEMKQLLRVKGNLDTFNEYDYILPIDENNFIKVKQWIYPKN